MPVPKSTVESSPRKLLRDVVYDKMLAALRDGTLQHGERLNDDELVQWLGVSRTPIREAIEVGAAVVAGRVHGRTVVDVRR